MQQRRKFSNSNFKKPRMVQASMRRTTPAGRVGCTCCVWRYTLQFSDASKFQTQGR